MNDTAALIIAQDCAPNALTLRGYNMLLAVSSPYVIQGREPTDVDALFADYILRGKTADTLAADFIDRLATEADALDPAAAAKIHTAVKAALKTSELALLGVSGGGKGLKPSNGITPAYLLRCAAQFGWTSNQTLDTPFATLLLMLREEQVQAGKAVSFAQMHTINQMQAAAAEAAKQSPEAANV